MDSIWDRTTGFVGDHWRAIRPIAIVGVLVPVAIEIVVAGAASGCGPAIDPVIAGIVAILAALATIWAQLALVALVLSPDGTARRRATAAFGRSVGAMLLLFVALAVVAIPLAVAVAATGAMTIHDGCGSMADGSGKVGWFVPLYGIVVGLAAAFVSIRLTMLYPVIVAEGGVVSAIRRAFALSRGLFWKLLGVWLVFGLVYAIASLAATTAFGTIFRLIAPNAGPFGVTTILAAILVASVRVAFTVVVATFTALLYRTAVLMDAAPARIGEEAQPAA